jgi:galactonate dehydratase
MVQDPMLAYIVEPSLFNFEQGYVLIPTGNGLEITMNEEAIREAAKQGHRWRSPQWRDDDGSVTEW